MNVLRFRARNAADAVSQIHSQLGAEAVVLSVTPLPTPGLSRLWRKPRLEVLAGLPTPEVQRPQPRDGQQELTPHNSDSESREESSAQSAERRSAVQATGFTPTESSIEHPDIPDSASPAPPGLGGHWRSGLVLHQMGLQPLYVEKVLERARESHGDLPPASLAHELTLVRSILASFWRPPPRVVNNSPPTHVFIGPPGSGKTTVLCKWLAKAVLGEGLAARAWRLDSRAANFPGLLDFYGEILGVTVKREWQGVEGIIGCDAGFVDLPGIVAQDAAAIRQLRAKVEAFVGAQVHLVLNAAYDAAALLAQARAFASLPVSDLILTHLDEEARLGKLWNLVLGTNFAVGYLSGGQNIPGHFCVAGPEWLISRKNR